VLAPERVTAIGRELSTVRVRKIFQLFQPDQSLPASPTLPQDMRRAHVVRHAINPSPKRASPAGWPTQGFFCLEWVSPRPYAELMPWGLTRYHHTGQSHFVTFFCCHRLLLLRPTRADESLRARSSA